jgi:hypothetical protein
MREWPPIVEPELVQRMTLDDERFAAFYRGVADAWPSREFNPDDFEHALGYPWERPSGSFVLRGEAVELLGDLEAAKRAATIATCTEGRHPIVSFGANVSPSRLAMKFAHFTEETDREVLVLTGYLHELDIGAVPSAPLLGYAPASLFSSPGTAVRAAIVWVTPAQATQLAWSEMTYRLGCLENARFEVDEIDLEIEELFAFVARLGALCIDGSPVALAAVPARNRTASALTQVEILEAIARLAIGPDAGAEDLARAACEDMSALMARAAAAVWPRGRQLSGWTAFPAPEAATS